MSATPEQRAEDIAASAIMRNDVASTLDAAAKDAKMWHEKINRLAWLFEDTSQRLKNALHDKAMSLELKRLLGDPKEIERIRLLRRDRSHMHGGKPKAA